MEDIIHKNYLKFEAVNVDGVNAVMSGYMYMMNNNISYRVKHNFQN